LADRFSTRLRSIEYCIGIVGKSPAFPAAEAEVILSEASKDVAAKKGSVSPDTPIPAARALVPVKADAAVAKNAEKAGKSGAKHRRRRDSVDHFGLLLRNGTNFLTFGAIAIFFGNLVYPDLLHGSAEPMRQADVTSPGRAGTRPVVTERVVVTPPPAIEAPPAPNPAAANLPASEMPASPPPSTPPPQIAQSAATPVPPPSAVPVTPPVTTPAVTPSIEIVAPPKQAANEAESIARFDELIARARDITPSIEDAVRVRDAFAAGSNIAQARTLRDQIVDPIARKLVDWHLYRNGAGTAREIKQFLEKNPDWPNRDLMMQRAEAQLFTSGGTARDIKGFFNGASPKSAVGEAALASAYLAEQNEADAGKVAGKAWRTGDIPLTLETGFTERFGKVLKESDHKWRLDRLLADDSRWENERRDRVAVVRRIVPFLSVPEQAKANARIAVYLRSPDANKLMAALPADAATNPADWGFTLQLVQWHRRAGRMAEAWAILKDAPTAEAEIVSPDDWWVERRLAAYDAMKAGKADLAYDLVKAPGELGVNARKDAAFFAGWLALKHLNKPDLAETHFRDLEKAADGPLSRGKAGYWLAKTYEAVGNPDKARSSYEVAARNTDTFYGMLARQFLEPGVTRLPVTPPKQPSDTEADVFNARDAVKATVIARKSGVDQSVTRVFLTHLRNILPSEPEQALLAHLAEAMGDTQMAVRIGKSAIARGQNLITYAYPVHTMPAYQPLRPPPEPAFLLGVARQESEFNISTKSGAGARGLLQVMPITAQHICKDYKLKCEIERLQTDASYNAMMASAYIGDRMDEFAGSYVLTLAGYNAGPGRARQWIKEFGDPRDPKVDPIDWIHRIPFEETREYVLKVLSNIQIYRARLGDEANALRLENDLRRTGNLRRPTAADNRF
jgi:soluble lytic murein transglycosylase